MKKISCIITLYNDEKNIERCINSIIRNNYKNIEILIINDGSTDNSLALCECLSKEFSEIRIINQDNMGVCSARNRGIEEFDGDYALFIDSDDYIDSNMLPELNEYISEFNNPDLIQFDYKRDYEGNIVDSFENDGSITRYTGKEAAKEYILKNKHFSMVLWRRLYKKEILKKVCFEVQKLPEDLATAFYVYASCKDVIHISKSYYNYYIKNDGLSYQNTQIDYINLYNIMKKNTKDELSFFKNDTKMEIEIKNIYENYLLTIYAKFYKSQKNKIRNDYLKIISNEIIDNYQKEYKLKTKIACLIFKINKRVFCSIATILNRIQIKGR